MFFFGEHLYSQGTIKKTVEARKSLYGYHPFLRAKTLAIANNLLYSFS